MGVSWVKSIRTTTTGAFVLLGVRFQIRSRSKPGSGRKEERNGKSPHMVEEKVIWSGALSSPEAEVTNSFYRGVEKDFFGGSSLTCFGLAFQGHLYHKNAPRNGPLTAALPPPRPPPPLGGS